MAFGKSSRMTSRLSTYGPKNGVCNICGKHGLLTHDHIPPKGCIKLTRMELRHIVDIANVEKAEPRDEATFTQDGVKYRTLCARCNNVLLGQHYDPAFIDFANGVGEFLKTSIELPQLMYIRGKPQRILRAALGHLIAFELDRHDKGTLLKNAAKYFLDPNKHLPPEVNVYYWIYPFKDQILVRDACLKDFRLEGQFAFWLMKFFPLAFFVTWEQPAGYRINHLNMGDYGKFGIDDEVEIPIPLDRVPHQFWPESPTSTSIILYGQGAMRAQQRSARRRRKR